MANPDCPCGSGPRLHLCCGPFLAGEAEPPDAETLMRSRYAAFALGEVDHLVRTLDPAHEDRARPKDELVAELRRACRTSRYRGLAVLDVAPPDPAGVALVLFVATVFVAGRDRSFVERSRFRHDGKGWRYWQGDARPAASFADPRRLTLVSFSAEPSARPPAG